MKRWMLAVALVMAGAETAVADPPARKQGQEIIDKLGYDWITCVRGLAEVAAAFPIGEASAVAREAIDGCPRQELAYLRALVAFGTPDVEAEVRREALRRLEKRVQEIRAAPAASPPTKPQ